MSYNVTVQDVESRWRVLSPTEAAVAQVLIADLESDLDLHRPALSDTILGLNTIGDARSLQVAAALERSIKRVIANAVKRALRNPDTYRSVNLTADGGIQVGYDNSSEGLDNNEGRLSPEDFLDVDAAIRAATGANTQSVGSAQLSSAWSTKRSRNLLQLPLP